MFVCISPYLEESLALRPIPEARKQASQLMPLGVLETSILLLLWPSRQKDVTFLVTCENLWPAGTESRNQAQPLAEARNPQVGMEVDFSLFSLPTHLYLLPSHTFVLNKCVLGSRHVHKQFFSVCGFWGWRRSITPVDYLMVPSSLFQMINSPLTLSAPYFSTYSYDAQL